MKRLTLHRAKQQDLPCCANFNTVAVYEKVNKTQDSRCHFGRQTTSRPFFGPLVTSCSGSTQKTRAVATRQAAMREKRMTVRGLSGPANSLF